MEENTAQVEGESTQIQARDHVEQRVYAFPAGDSVPVDEINVFDLWRKVWARKKFVSRVSLLAAVAMGGLSFLITPVYTASVLMQPVSNEESGGLQAKLASQIGGLASIGGLSLGGDTTVEQSIATIKSRVFTQAFITENNLLPILFEDDWDAQQQAFKKPSWFTIEIARLKAKLQGRELDLNKLGKPTPWKAFKVFDELRGISRSKKEGLVTLTVTMEDPELAAKWANAMVALVNRQLRVRDAVEAQKSIAYLNKEIEKTNLVNLRETLYHLIEEQTQIAMLTNVREDYVFKVIDPAVVPEEKSAPNRVLLVMVAFILAILSSAAWVVVPRAKSATS
jgi:uncharacterized protein involved in exopolysaccharide biosynthesis